MSEPNNNAEEQLKRYAAERRGQGAPELHPATRRILQGEVGRVYGTRGAAGRTGWRRWLLAPGLAWALGLAVVAGMTLLVVRESGPRRKTEDAASVAEKSEVKKEKAIDEVAKIEAAPASVLREPVGRIELPAEKKSIETKATMAGPVVVDRARVNATQSPQRALRDESVAGPVFANRAYLQLTPPPAAASAPVAAASAPSGPAREAAVPKDAEMVGGMGGRRMGEAQAAAQAQVMNRFRMQQVGQSVRFEDADKSVYAGPVTAQQAGTNSFRAVGTNLTLRQPVVVTGQFYKMQRPGQQQQPQQQGVLKQQQQYVGGKQVLGAGDEYSYRVQGQATVGTSNNVLIDAASAAGAP